MRITLAFDVYGTLIDTAGIADALRPYAGPRSEDFAQSWREKQLEYTFRRALMRCYVDFAQCTREALTFTCERFKVVLDDEKQQALLARYRSLPAFPDVAEGLQALSHLPLRLYAFSNGRAADVAELLRNAGIAQHFEGIVSLEETRTYKPDPAAYAYFHRRAATAGDPAWLISSNAFDVIGAAASGMQSIWIKRSDKAVFDPWEISPAHVYRDIKEVAAYFGEASYMQALRSE